MRESKVNVLSFLPALGFPVPEEVFQKIGKVSPRINSVNASTLSDSASNGDSKAQKKLDVLMAEAEVIFGFPLPGGGIPLKNITVSAPKLKWVQCAMSGVDAFGFPEFKNSDILLTNSSGMHGVQVGETALMHIINMAKNGPKVYRGMAAHKWDPFIPIILEKKTVGLIGLGPIGKYIAKLCKSFGMRVIAVEVNPKVKCRYCDTIFPGNKMLEVLGQADFVVDCLPLIPPTAKIFGLRQFEAMKPTAFFINIGRGGTVDHDALFKALQSKEIAGAGLDALDTEPLPSTSKLWELPNVTVTPHIGGRREDYNILAIDLFVKNLNRYVNRKKLLNIISKI
ncbi:MAG: D-2-hydroxyacid dehydrogenase [Syntrophales bacterium]|jgi:phosphoglycerate dehydrogenase-like enzyme|nr:D-2-hydroxyacid dehydrogenase [Syntrophales bacterium]